LIPPIYFAPESNPAILNQNFDTVFRYQNIRFESFYGRLSKVFIAATGKLLVASDFFSPMVAGFEVWPGYGGLIYEGLHEGRIMALQVLPKTTSPNSTSTA
jgi:hypothetical protein